MNCLTKTSPEQFGEEYYRTGNYADYLERGPRYHQIAIELDQLLSTLNLLSCDEAIVDFGCGVGFLCESLIALGHKNVFGTDESKWAQEELVRKGIPVYKMGTVGVMVALDVFEHMMDLQIKGTMIYCRPKVIVCRIPIAKEGENQFALEISRKDKTHINCKTKSQWIQFFKDLGFPTVLRLNMRTIYDSEGVACLLCIR